MVTSSSAWRASGAVPTPTLACLAGVAGPEPARVTRASRRPSPAINFSDPLSAHGSKTTFKLLIGNAVFKACGFPFLVEHAVGLLDRSRKVLASAVTDTLMMRTFFHHFCAGGDGADMRPVIEMLGRNNVDAPIRHSVSSPQRLGACTGCGFPDASLRVMR